MFDARYVAFTTLSALLVISPGATLAVVVETALAEGRRAALLTVLGVGIANSTLAMATAFGLSVVFDRWPPALHTVRFAGAAYIGYLGLRGLWLARSPRRWASPTGTGSTGTGSGTISTGEGSDTISTGEGSDTISRDAPPCVNPSRGAQPSENGPGSLSCVMRGVLTNLLNPPVLIFYMTVVPQFIGPRDPFLPRALLLGATHVAMSMVWQGSCGLAVGVLADRMARPAVRRTLEAVTGAVLVALAVRLLR